LAADAEVRRGPGRDVVPRAQQILDLALGAVHRVLAGDLDADGAQGVRAEEARARGRQGDQHLVAGIPRPARALARERPHHLEVDPPDLDGLVDGPGAAEQGLDHGGPQHRDLAARALVDLVEEAAALDRLVVDPEPGRRDPEDGGRGVLRQVLDLGVLAQLGRHGGDVADLLGDGLRVLGDQGLHAGRAHRPLAHEPGAHHQQVGAQALDLGRHALLGALADGHHDDDRPDADDDPEHGQRGPRLALGQAGEGDAGELLEQPQARLEGHGAGPRAGDPAARASARPGTVSSVTSRPSRNVTMRAACSATSRSWVTMTMVLPAR